MPAPAAPPAPVPDLLGDLLDLDTPAPPAPVPTGAPAGGVLDLMGGLDLDGSPAAGGPPAAAPAAAAPAAAPASQLPVLLGADKGKGLVIHGALAVEGRSHVLKLQFDNVSAGSTLDGFMIQLNKNVLGLQPANQVIAVAPVAPGASAAASVVLDQKPAMAAPAGGGPYVLQIAIKCTQLGVLYLSSPISLGGALAEDGRIESTAFVQAWKDIPEAEEVQQSLPVTITETATATQRLNAAKLFVMANKTVGGEEVLYVTGRAMLCPDAVQLLLELRFVAGQPGVRAFFRCTRPDVAPLVFDAVAAALS